MTIDQGVGLFMGVPMRTICSKRLVVLNVYTSRAPPVCTDQLAQRNRPSYLTLYAFLRFGPGRAQVTALSFFDKRAGQRGNLVSQRRLTCRRDYSSGLQILLHAPITRRRDSRVACTYDR